MSSSLTWSIIFLNLLFKGNKNVSPRPGIEPGPSTWQAEILTTRLSRIVLEWAQTMFEHACDRPVDQVASCETVHSKVCPRHAIGKMKNAKKCTNPSSRIWTSDLWISGVNNYSPPLYQLSYRRWWWKICTSKCQVLPCLKLPVVVVPMQSSLLAGLPHQWWGRSSDGRALA